MVRLIIALSFALLSGAAFAEANLSKFAGSRSGFTNFPVSEGKTETFKCVSIISPNGTRMTLRCANASLPSSAINTVLTLKQTGSSVSGTWEEKAYNLEGPVTGQLSDNSLRASFEGGGAKGKVEIKLMGTALSVTVHIDGYSPHTISLK